MLSSFFVLIILWNKSDHLIAATMREEASTSSKHSNTQPGFLYKSLKLKNNMKSLLASDPSIEKSAVSMVVGIGPINSVEKVPGLITLLGYALIHDFEDFIKNHNGHVSVTTDEDSQTFSFDVNAHSLIPALDLFAKNFMEPNLNNLSDHIDELVQMVDAEFNVRSIDDRWAIAQVEKSISEENHPYRNSFVGNAQILYSYPILQEEPIILPWGNFMDRRRSFLQSELKTFFSTWYSSNIITLAIHGRESLEILEKTVTSLFEKFPDKKLKPITFTSEQHPWGKEQLQHKIYIRPLSEHTKLLRLIFPTQEHQDDNKTMPEHYVINLLTNHAPGSLATELEESQLCRHLGAEYETFAGIGFFRIDCDHIDETDDETINEIISLIFQYIYIIKTKGIQEWFFDECQNMSEIRFLLQPYNIKYSVIHQQYFATLMQKYPVEDIILSRCRPRSQWNSASIIKFLNFLNPDNMNVMIVSDTFDKDTDLVEDWYGTQYKIEKIQRETLEKWKTIQPTSRLKLPQQNEFVAQNFSLYSTDQNEPQYPYVIHKSAISEIWFKQDDKFLKPNLSIHLEIITSEVYLSPSKGILLDVFIATLNLFLEEYLLPANTTGLEFKIEKGGYGILIHIHGLHDKLPILLKKILMKLTSFNFDLAEQHFDLIKEESLQMLGNLNSTTLEEIRNLLIGFTYSTSEIFNSSSEITHVEFQKFVHRMQTSSIFVRGLIHGNSNLQKAMEIVNTIVHPFHSARHLLIQQRLPNRLVQLNKGHFHYSVYSYNPGHELNTYAAYFQYHFESLRNEIIGVLLRQIFEKFSKEFQVAENFNNCETGSMVLRLNNMRGFLFIIESEEQASYVDSKLEEFLQHIPRMIQDMPEIMFENQKKEVLKTLEESEQSFGATTEIYWSEISKQIYAFDRVTKQVEELKSIEKNDVLRFFEEILDELSFERRKLSVSVLGKSSLHHAHEKIMEVPQGATKIADVNDFKNNSHIAEIIFRRTTNHNSKNIAL